MVSLALGPASPRVHVLLEPGGPGAPAPALSRGPPYTVCVMGLHRSGTHALREYLEQFFEGEHEPRPRRTRAGGRLEVGTVELAGGHQLWKHAVPLAPFRAPAAGPGGAPAVVLLTVRSPQSWICSLSKHAYEIFPRLSRRRPQGRLSWMFEEVIMATGNGLFADPFPDAVFPSVPELWAAYARGYLYEAMGGQDDPSSGPIYVIVRFEDIVLRPGAVVEALARLGLPRNSVPFEPIEETASGGPDDRGRVARKLQDGSASQQLDLAGFRHRLRGALAPHGELLRWLGYEAELQSA